MGDAVVLAKKSPYAVFVIWVAAIKLYGFQFGKLLNQRLVNDQPLIAVNAPCIRAHRRAASKIRSS